jgi:NitT/TauT family transport system ATP-binding protein
VALELINIQKSFPAQGGDPEVAVLQELEYGIPQGRFVSLIGPSGCGKTTLLRIIAGLEPAGAGEVLLDGEAVNGPSRRVGLVFQEYALFPWRTTLQNIEFGLEMQGQSLASRRRAAQDYIAAFDLDGFENRYPRELSGGMQQRVAIARTLIMEPKVILMDEPFGSLDSQTRNGMQEFLLKIWQERRDTVIFVTHNVDEAVFLSDEIVVLSRRPARVLERFSVDHPRPRDRTGPETNALRRQVLSLLDQQRETA